MCGNVQRRGVLMKSVRCFMGYNKQGASWRAESKDRSASTFVDGG
jgi:hypothetical protein